MKRRTMHSRRAAAGIAAAFALGAPSSALAGDPFEIQVYDGTLNPPGAIGIEDHLNYWATGWRDSNRPEGPLHGQFHSTLEPSLGVLPFWELGAYIQFAVRTDDGVADGAGVKLRSKFATPPGWDPHWRFGLNLEVSYLPSAYDRSRWGSEVRPILAWSDPHWFFAINPIFDQSLTAADAANGPSFQPCAKVARTLGPVALGLEYYATFGPGAAFVPLPDQGQQIFEVMDLLSVDRFELNVGVGEGLTRASEGIVFKAIVGYTFERPARARARDGAGQAAPRSPYPAWDPLAQPASWRTTR